MAMLMTYLKKVAETALSKPVGDCVISVSSTCHQMAASQPSAVLRSSGSVIINVSPPSPTLGPVILHRCTA